MDTSKEKSALPKSRTKTKEMLVEGFYNLRKSFEASYSGILRNQKYEETRKFNIALIHAIFQVNQLDLNDSEDNKSLKKLFTKLEIIQQDFQKLKAWSSEY